MVVDILELRGAVRGSGVVGRPVCVHSSLRSFGWVEGGADAVVDALVAEGCTVMVPSRSSACDAPSLEGRVVQRNAYDRAAVIASQGSSPVRFSASSSEINPTMGRIPAAVLARPGRWRGNHPRGSFTAIGPLARALVAGQAPLNVYAPLRTLAELGGDVVLMGVNLTRMTLLHAAEQDAGRNLFRRWAYGENGEIIECEDGGCSAGFEALARALRHLERTVSCGESTWRIYPARAALAAATAAILVQPSITRCKDPECGRCEASIAGGPIL